MIAPGHKFFALHKAVGFDFDGADAKQFPINYHFFSTNSVNYSRKEQNYFDADGGGKAVGYNATTAAQVFATVMGSPTLFVSYNRHAGEQDVRVPLDIHCNLSQVDRDAFNACMKAIVARGCNAVCVGIARLTTAFVPFGVVFLFNTWGVSGVVSVIGALLVVQAATMALLGHETAGRSLEVTAERAAAEAYPAAPTI